MEPLDQAAFVVTRNHFTTAVTTSVIQHEVAPELEGVEPLTLALVVASDEVDEALWWSYKTEENLVLQLIS